MNTIEKPMGGSEIMLNALNQRVDTSSINLMLSTCHPSLLSNTKPNVLWEQLSYDQENVALLQDVNYVNQLDAIVFVSHWQHEQFRKRFPLDSTPCYVIPNAVEPFEYTRKPDRIKLIYTSTPWRGLSILVECLKILDRDVDVEIYSGTSIYGSDFHNANKHQYQDLYKEIENLGINRVEYAPNCEIRKAVNRSHILAYPSIFEETSCIAAIEALSAGAKVVTTNFGALYETCGPWADYVPLSHNFVQEYTDALRRNIDRYFLDEEERFYQREHYKRFWSWDRRIQQWTKLIDDIYLKLRKRNQSTVLYK